MAPTVPSGHPAWKALPTPNSAKKGPYHSKETHYQNRFSSAKSNPSHRISLCETCDQTIVFNDLPTLIDCDRTVDVLWELSLNFKQETPGWQGMMHIIHQGLEHPGQSSVVFLPMIDLNSGDKMCILSTRVLFVT